MYDKRVHRGNTFAAMVIPAGTNHDTMLMEKQQTTKRTFKSVGSKVSCIENELLKKPATEKPVYPNRDIPSPEPVPGRRHFEIQTEPYTEYITDKPPVSEKKVATEFYLDRPPVPLFQPKMPLKENCKAT